MEEKSSLEGVVDFQFTDQQYNAYETIYLFHFKYRNENVAMVLHQTHAFGVTDSVNLSFCYTGDEEIDFSFVREALHKVHETSNEVPEPVLPPAPEMSVVSHAPSALIPGLSALNRLWKCFTNK